MSKAPTHIEKSKKQCDSTKRKQKLRSYFALFYCNFYRLLVDNFKSRFIWVIVKFVSGGLTL